MFLKKLSLNNCKCYDVLINYDLTNLRLFQCMYIYTYFDHLQIENDYQSIT